MTRHRRSLMVPCDKCISDGRALERAEIVEWLRDPGDSGAAAGVVLLDGDDARAACNDLADAIDEGEHEPVSGSPKQP